MTFLSKLAKAKKVPLWFFDMKKAGKSEQEICSEIKTNIVDESILNTKELQDGFTDLIYQYYNKKLES